MWAQIFKKYKQQEKETGRNEGELIELRKEMEGKDKIISKLRNKL